MFYDGILYAPTFRAADSFNMRGHIKIVYPAAMQEGLL